VVDRRTLADCVSHRTWRVLTPVFVVLALSTSAIAFFFPLEIETRESTVWLHVLALREGVNIYDHAQVAFINQNHGPFDPLFKLAIATMFPFLDAWHVARFPVLLLPFVFLLATWKLLGDLHQRSLPAAVYLGAIGYLFLMVSAKEFLFVGRSDATAALLLLPLIYLSVAPASGPGQAAALRGLVWGGLGTAVVLTNWRMAPTVLALLIFSVSRLYYGSKLRHRDAVVYLSACVFASTAVFIPILFEHFDFDVSLYYQHFFGTYSKASGHGHRTYAHASAMWFLGSLLKPTANPDNLKGGPVLLALAVYLLVPGKASVQNKVWFLLGSFVFAACALAFYLNYYGGGQWYFIPFLIVLWGFLCVNFPAMSAARLSAVGVVMMVFLGANAGTVIAPSLWRGATLSRAQAFMGELRSLQLNHSILSEDTFFFRTAYEGELIDMGDMISRIRRRGAYYGDEFNRTVDRHFERVRRDPPDYIVTGFTESPELRRFAAENYILVAQGPANLTANGSAESRLFRRKDLAGPNLSGRQSAATANQRRKP